MRLDRAAWLLLPPAVAGCLFWEDHECMQTKELCGVKAITHVETETNQCNRFAFFLNHANDHCGPNDADDEVLDEYRDCFWDELAAHLAPLEDCESVVCADSYLEVTDEKQQTRKRKMCREHCFHIHACLTRCNNKRYAQRDSITSCLSDCNEESADGERLTCRGRCMGHAANRQCWCDPTCVYTGDCCPDYENWCLARGAGTLGRPNETAPVPSLNVTSKTMEQSRERDFVRVDPAELGINMSEHPNTGRPPKDFNASRGGGMTSLDDLAPPEEAGGDEVDPPEPAKAEEEDDTNTQEKAQDTENQLIQTRSRLGLRGRALQPGD